MLAAGLACLVAAVVGGGLKAAGWEFPALNMIKRILLAAFGVALVIAANAERVHEAWKSATGGSQPAVIAPTAVQQAPEPSTEALTQAAPSRPLTQVRPVPDPAYLTIRVTPESASITVDGKPYHSTLSIPDGGTLQIRAEAAEHSAATRIVRLEPGDRREVSIALKACRREPVTEVVTVRGKCSNLVDAQEIRKSFQGSDCFSAYDSYKRWCEVEIGGTPHAMRIPDPASTCQDGRTLHGVCYVCTTQEEKHVGTKLVCD